MRSDIDQTISANMVMMLRAGIDGAIWIVDDAEEGIFYEAAAHKKSRVVTAPGGAAELLQIVIGRGIHGVVGVTRGATREIGDLPLYRPDIGDVASMLLMSRGADRVLGEVGGGTWLTACGREIRGIVETAVCIARRLEHLLGGREPTEEELRELVNWDSAEINWQVFESGGHFTVSPEQIATARRIEWTDNIEAALIHCDGISVVRVLAAAAQHYRPRGIPARSKVTEKELLRLLRAGFDLEEIEKEGVYWRLKDWEWRNKRYILFRQWRKFDSFNILLDQRYLHTDIEQLAKCDIRFAVVQLDLDHFKNVNDKLGHLEGDEAIKLVERTLLDALGGRGEGYRRGGDELAAVIIGVTRAEAEKFAELLRQDIESKFLEWAKKRDLTPAPTASIGVVHVSGVCLSEKLLPVLEAAQLQAKQSGKNRVVVTEVTS